MAAAVEPKTDRYAKKTRRDGTTQFIKKKSITEKVGRMLSKQPDDSLYADPVIIPLPRQFRDESIHSMPIDFSVVIGETDELLDRAYRRLKGMTGVKLRNVVTQVTEKLILEKYEECLTMEPEQVLHYLDRNLRAAGLTVQGAVSWQRRYKRYEPARGNARDIGH